jgi:hypothetical protein
MAVDLQPPKPIKSTTAKSVRHELLKLIFGQTGF